LLERENVASCLLSAASQRKCECKDVRLRLLLVEIKDSGACDANINPQLGFRHQPFPLHPDDGAHGAPGIAGFGLAR
jgi:hypothetical protein